MKLLIDGDWLCYSLACAFTTINPFGEEPLPIFDFGGAKTKVDATIEKWISILDAEDVEIHFTHGMNFRKELMESYKANRKGKPKPVGLAPLREYCENLYDCVSEPRLEADDTLGICATKDKDSVIVSVDKDFLTIPAHIYNPNKQILKKQSRVNAFKSFIYQVLIGDSSDGYKGIKGIGPKKALQFINAQSKNLMNIWEPLVELAKSKGQDEEHLLLQSRMAFILQTEYYDWDTKTITLWEPTHIERMLK